jgi:hypothetical protein
MMINRKAKAISTPIPADVIMHDWWIALNVAMHGKIFYVSIPSVLYRQHFTNYMGISSVRRINILNFFKRVNCLKKLLSAQYKMVKKVDPNASFRSLLLNTIKVKIAQRCR